MKNILDDLDNMMYKAELDSITRSIKLSKKNMKFVFAILALNTFNLISAIYNLITHHQYILYSPLILLWLLVVGVNIFTIKNEQKKIKTNKIQYDDIMKIIDPIKYIKDQRKEKLKKLKKIF